MVDTLALTEVSVPRTVQNGDTVLGEFINNNSLLTIEVTKEFGLRQKVRSLSWKY
ncbi:hypothetical protein [Tissierella creatinophila]|uniref:Zinc-transporting ATPase n=1 Tax=Tissierella creatinophila DSM 6911 TaxID=1123403 RepID=A0A1U7M8D0_TISCR|nr:hypothetical protein [Tissierella creatinophila]OLS03572.1 zinc-transporting ATPase [Tissierella creatinophila DSM 6911]